MAICMGGCWCCGSCVGVVLLLKILAFFFLEVSDREDTFLLTLFPNSVTNSVTNPEPQVQVVEEDTLLLSLFFLEPNPSRKREL